jgi:uncharacterized membrane protein
MMNDLENKMELKISKFLRNGVVVSGIIIAIGWAMSFKPDSDPFASLQTYESFNLIDSLQMHAILQNWGKLISYLGLTILISLPVLRVFLSMILFITQKEKTMALIGAIVLIGLILSFSLGVETH